MRWPFILACVLFVHTAEASVTITEIAWMGDTLAADNEWIELHNSGAESVSLEGWRLSVVNWTTGEESFSIPLTNALAPSSYGVLERTNDESAEGPALLLYSGALVNTGATLSLYDEDGDLVDRVAGGDAWEHVKGDNVSKKTAQKSTHGWVTATPTPGRAVTVEVEEDEEEEDDVTDEETPQTQNSRASEDAEPVTIELTLPDTELTITAEVPVRAYVNQEILLSAIAEGLGRTHLNSLSYNWNFGDLSTAVGKEVSHTYLHPGQYVVTLTASFGRHSDTARAVITVLPVSFSLSWGSDGVLHIHNNARYEVDMSGYELRMGNTRTFPPGTILLPNATLTLSPNRHGIRAHTYGALYDQQGSMVATTLSSSIVPVEQKEAPVPLVAQVVSAGSTQAPEVEPPQAPSNFSFKGEVIEDEDISEERLETTVDQTELLSSTKETNTEQKSIQWPYMALAGVLGLGCLGILAGRIR